MLLVSLLCNLTGLRFLANFRIKDFDSIGNSMRKSFDILVSGSPFSMVLVGSILITVFGVLFSSLAIINSIYSLRTDSSLIEYAFSYFTIFLLVLNIMISIYLLLPFIILLVLVILLFFILLTLGTNYSGKGSSVFVRGYFRKGSYVRSHRRKRPRK